MPKVQLIDRVGNWGAAGIALAYFVAFFAFLIAGAAGPVPNETVASPTIVTPCLDPVNCMVTLTGSLGATKYNQNLWMTLAMNRPYDVNGNYALLNVPIMYSQVYQCDLVGYSSSGVPTVIAANVSHVASMSCPPGNVQCGTPMVWTQSFLNYASYSYTLRIMQPWSYFAANTIIPGGNATFVTSGYRIAASYTTFQLGATYFFFAVSLIMFGVYTWALIKGKGTRDPSTGTWLPMTDNQVWCWWLSLGLIFYNNPLFAAGLFSPSIAVAGFYAFCQFSFLVTLLFYWLVIFDRNRIITFRMISATRHPQSLYQRCCQGLSRTGAALCFWVPKLVLMTLFWVMSLAYYLFQKYMELSDPAYSITDAFPQYAQFFQQFGMFIAAVYTIWIFCLVAVGMCGCARLNISARFIMGVTMASIIIVVSGYLANGFFAQRQTSLLFMEAYGAINSYMWFLQIALLPIYVPLETDINPPAVGVNKEDDYFSKDGSADAETQTETGDLEAAAAVHVVSGAGRGGASAAPQAPYRSSKAVGGYAPEAQPDEADAVGTHGYVGGYGDPATSGDIDPKNGSGRDAQVASWR